jgi:outer membrane receptor protein involved in Fe transport
VDANTTYSPSKSNEKDLSGNELPFYDNSEKQFNLIGWYQADKLQARIAYNYRSKRYNGEATQGVRLFADATAYVDANISYDVLDDVTVYLNASNITGEMERYQLDFSKGDTQFASINEFEARYTLGVRAKF